MFVIGLTGGIGSGKSTVTQILSKLGAEVIDADTIGHDVLLTDNFIREQLVDSFGKNILKQKRQIDRKKLAKIVFDDPEALKKLNDVMHPRMHTIVEKKIEDMRSRNVSVVVLEATLLIEANWTDLVNEIWVVIASEDTVINRIIANRNITEKQVKARIMSQMPIYEKTKYGNVVIENNAGFTDLLHKVEEIWRHRVKS